MLYHLTGPVEDVNDGNDVRREIEVEGEVAFRLEYRSTDAWRGHYDAVPADGSDWVKVKEGWVTGDWDDAPVEARASNVKAAVEKIAEEAEGDVAVVFAPTSNVFSTTYDVFVRGGMPTYRVKRFSRGKPAEVRRTGLTLEEAQAHCNDNGTRGDDWFDGYEREDGDGD